MKLVAIPFLISFVNKKQLLNIHDFMMKPDSEIGELVPYNQLHIV